MPEFELSKARTFLESALEFPLFEHMGEPIGSSGVIHAKTIKQLGKALDSNERFWTEQAYHHTGMILDSFGWEWKQEHNSQCVRSIQSEIDETDLGARIDAAWTRIELPGKLGYSDTKQWANNWFRTIAYDHALSFDGTRSFERHFVEPWLLRGRLPCGWKGKPARNANLDDIDNPWKGVTVTEFSGDGQLIVF